MNNSITFKPYLIHSFYIWSLENNRTAYFKLDKKHVSINPEYEIEDDTFTLQVHPTSIRNLVFSINSILFTTFFNGFPHTVEIPYSSIKRIFCKDTEYGFNFDDNNHITETQGTYKPVFSVIKGGK